MVAQTAVFNKALAADSACSADKSANRTRVKRILQEFGTSLAFCRPSQRRLPDVVCAAEHLPAILADLFCPECDDQLSDSTERRVQ